MNKFEKILEIRNKLNQGLPSIGSWMQIPNSSIAEIMASGNFDWITVDLEHGSTSHHQLPDIFRAIELGNKVPLARISEGSMTLCKQALDAGSGGLIIPMIESAKQLEDCIAWSCWPPKGIRGVGFSRANLFGKNFQDYNKFAQNPLIIAQIENKKAIDNLEDILTTPGLDAIIIGPYDLSASLGITAEFDNPLYISKINMIRDICKIKKIPNGIHVVDPSPQLLNIKISEGYQFIAYSIDTVILRSNLL